MTETSTRTALVSEVDFAGRQIVGTRPRQEDSYGIMPPEVAGLAAHDLLAILADGMGGHAAGEVASALAVEEFARGFLDLSDESDPEKLQGALMAANRSIAVRVGQDSGALQGMGTTLVALLVRGLAARWISVGDSPLMLWRAGRLHLLNSLHSFDNAPGGYVTDGETRVRPGCGLLASAVNGEALHEVDAPEAIILQADDILLAASDGINSLSIREIGVILEDCSHLDAAEIAEFLLDSVSRKALPDQDNATLIVVRIADPNCNQSARSRRQ